MRHRDAAQVEIIGIAILGLGSSVQEGGGGAQHGQEPLPDPAGHFRLQGEQVASPGIYGTLPQQPVIANLHRLHGHDQALVLQQIVPG